jgi:hypothetical protein
MAMRGFASLRLPGPADRKQSAPGASGKPLVSGVSASALDSKAAAVPEPKVCAGAGEGDEEEGVTALGSADFSASAGEKAWRGPFSTFPKVRRKGRRFRAQQLRSGEGSAGDFLGFRHPWRFLRVSPATLPSPSPTGRFCSISRPCVSRRVLGVICDGGGCWAGLPRGLLGLVVLRAAEGRTVAPTLLCLGWPVVLCGLWSCAIRTGVWEEGPRTSYRGGEKSPPGIKKQLKYSGPWACIPYTRPTAACSVS